MKRRLVIAIVCLLALPNPALAWPEGAQYDQKFSNPLTDVKFHVSDAFAEHDTFLREVQAIAQAERRLLWMPTIAEFEERRAAGWMISSLWQGQEQQLYHAEHAALLKAIATALATIETRLGALETR